MKLFRSISSLIAGYLAFLFLSLFPRIIFSLYSRTELRIHTVRFSDSLFQDVVMIGLDLFAAVLAALITTSIVKKRQGWHLAGLIALMIPEAIYMFSLPEPGESLFLVISTLCIRLLGLSIGYLVHRKLIHPD